MYHQYDYTVLLGIPAFPLIDTGIPQVQMSMMICIFATGVLHCYERWENNGWRLVSDRVRIIQGHVTSRDLQPVWGALG